jgi:hypothetical protein
MDTELRLLMYIYLLFLVYAFLHESLRLYLIMALLLFAERQDAGNLRRQDSLCWSICLRVDVLEIVLLFVRSLEESVQPLLLSVSLCFTMLGMNTENSLLIGVATERGEKVGETIGHSIRGETVKPNKTRLLFCTTGIILRTYKTTSRCLISRM